MIEHGQSMDLPRRANGDNQFQLDFSHMLASREIVSMRLWQYRADRTTGNGNASAHLFYR